MRSFTSKKTFISIVAAFTPTACLFLGLFLNKYVMEFLPDKPNLWIWLGLALSVGIIACAILNVLWWILSKRKVAADNTIGQDEMKYRRELHSKGVKLLERHVKWIARQKGTINIQEEYEWIKKQPEYHYLRPHLGKEPSLNVMNATQTGLESAFISWLRNRIDSFAKL